MNTEYFKGKTLLITGGTGSFGNTVLKHFLHSDIGEIRIFSRDEKKQDDMRHEYQQLHPQLAGKLRFLYRRRAQPGQREKRRARGGFYLSRRRTEAGAEL